MFPRTGNDVKIGGFPRREGEFRSREREKQIEKGSLDPNAEKN